MKKFLLTTGLLTALLMLEIKIPCRSQKPNDGSYKKDSTLYLTSKDTLNNFILSEAGARRAIQTYFDLDICRKIDREKSSIIIEHASKIILLERKVIEINAGYFADRHLWQSESLVLKKQNEGLEKKVERRGKWLRGSLVVNAVLVTIGYFLLR